MCQFGKPFVHFQQRHVMPALQDKKADIIQTILTEHFNIDSVHFDWEQPLENLDEQFKLLGNLVFLEQLLQKEFQRDIPLLENISTAFHTPRDILELIISEA